MSKNLYIQRENKPATEKEDYWCDRRGKTNMYKRLKQSSLEVIFDC